MNKVLYFITQVLFIPFSFKAEIIKPRKTESLRSLPAVFKVKRSKWFTFILGGGVFVVGILGLMIIGLNVQPYSAYNVWEFAVIETLLILAFINQLSLKGEIIVNDEQVEFHYKNMLGKTLRTESISSYDCIWIQKYKIGGHGQAHDGTAYSSIYLRHKWNRFRTLFLWKGRGSEDQAESYAKMFGLKIKKSFFTINKA